MHVDPLCCRIRYKKNLSCNVLMITTKLPKHIKTTCYTPTYFLFLTTSCCDMNKPGPPTDKDNCDKRITSVWFCLQFVMAAERAVAKIMSDASADKWLNVSYHPIVFEPKFETNKSWRIYKRSDESDFEACTLYGYRFRNESEWSPNLYRLLEQLHKL